MEFLDQIIFFEKFGRHMVTSFRSEGMARFGPNAYRWVFFGCVCKHACMHSQICADETNFQFFDRERAGAPIVVEVKIFVVKKNLSCEYLILS